MTRLPLGVPAYINDGTDAAATYAQRAGDHHDGMEYFGMNAAGQYDRNSSTRGLLVMNHEAITPSYLHPTGQTIVNNVRTVADEVLKEFFVHGVSVIEVNRNGSTWSYNQGSNFNRRVHTLTEIDLAGPARGNAAMITKFSPTGTRTRGTVNNCAHGYTPWYTYLACEENWAGYFRRVAATDNANRSAKELASFGRYGVAGNGRELWATVTPDTATDLYGRWRAEVVGANRRRRLPQRRQHLWVVRRDRPVQPQLGAEEADRDGPQGARRRLARPGRGWSASGLVHG